jgi:hypothetical protein
MKARRCVATALSKLALIWKRQVMEIRAAEISSILKDQIKNFGEEAEVSEIGQVLSVGDGIGSRGEFVAWR